MKATPRTTSRLAVVAALALMVTACGKGQQSDLGGTASRSGTDSGTVTLVVHDSWAVADNVIAAFEQESGLTVTIVPIGDAGTLANQLVLTKDSPLGDAFFGVDNTFASRIIDAGAVDPYIPDSLPASAQQYVIDNALTPVTMGDVCLNIDTAWFAAPGVTAPTHFNDLLAPELSGQTVVLNPASSSPGLALMLATISAFGDDGWLDFWTSLAAQDVTVADSWSDGYYSDFSGAGEGGTRPVVVSYSTSPAYTMNDDGTASTTQALLDTCFRQVEYAGVLHGANNPDGARALIGFLVSPTFQRDIPNQMFMYPVDASLDLPTDWAQFAPLSDNPWPLDPADIAANREQWLDEWTEAVLG
jgi:thiamine transport system substrate-binding protein